MGTGWRVARVAAALHGSGYGTKATYEQPWLMSAHWGEADSLLRFLGTADVDRAYFTKGLGHGVFRGGCRIPL